MKHPQLRNRLWILFGIALLSADVAAQGNQPIDVDKARVIDFWTPARRAAAIPRDLFIDPRGLGYLRHPSGYLEPYGHSTPAQTVRAEPEPSPFARPGGGGGGGGGKTGGSGDTTGPTITLIDPAEGATIGYAKVFQARVEDPSGVASVTFMIDKVSPNAESYTFQADLDGDGVTWFKALIDFTNGDWTWKVVARDRVRKGGNTSESALTHFTVAGVDAAVAPPGSTVPKAQWSSGGKVQTAAGRILFTMGGPNSYYVCSGTVVTDAVSGRSLIMTAAHCVYDDARKAFADNVLFIPNQAGGGSATDLNCNNDPIGCWVPSYGVVDRHWTSTTFPDNKAWDYAFYVVPDSGAHVGASASSPALDVAAGSLAPSFDAPKHDVTNSTEDYTHALGYSYSDDPKFMYCAEDMTTEGAVNWWLASCGLTGGASGGPWVQPMDTAEGSGPIISVNSWGYVDFLRNPLPGMAGPKLNGTSAKCVFDEAQIATGTTEPRGVVVDVGDNPTCP